MILNRIKTQTISVKKRLYLKALAFTKDLLQKFGNKNYHEKLITFIVGCQRSGTTLMYEVFLKDLNAKVYSEFGPLTNPDDKEHIRLKPFKEVQRIFSNQNVPLIVSNTLVETQNADKLLQGFNFSKIIWMYRDYRSVAISNVKHFGPENGIKDLCPIVNGDKNNWRSENVSQYTRTIIQRYFSENMNPYDAAALFWFARNRLYYELNLEYNSHIYMCKYENFVKFPIEEMQRIYKFIGLDYPGDHITSGIHREDLDRNNNIKLSPQIETLCNELYQKLEDTYKSINFTLNVA